MQLTKQHAIIMWVIWFAQLQAAFFFQFFLGGGLSEGVNADTPMALWLWAVCVVPIIAATGIRWAVLPRIKEPAQQLVWMVIGLALAEAAVLISIFLVGPDYPQYQIAILMVAVVGIIQFAPSYATPGYAKTQNT
jgi:hypothetical protein